MSNPQRFLKIAWAVIVPAWLIGWGLQGVQSVGPAEPDFDVTYGDAGPIRLEDEWGTATPTQMMTIAPALTAEGDIVATLANVSTAKTWDGLTDTTANPVTVAPTPTPRLTGDWRRAKASWYTGPTSRTADGTKMRLDGCWVATRLVPMGATIEIRNKAGKVWTVKRRDTPAAENGHRLDLPKGFWKSVTGAKYSAGLVELEWRVK